MNTVVLLACVAFQSDPSGTPEQLMLYKLARRYNQPSQVDAPLESMGLASSNFATRYCAALVQLHRCVESGRGYESAYQRLLRLSGSAGPERAADHLKALAASLKASVCCKDCKEGKVPCGTCQGKGRVDLPCNACKGAGRVRPSGAVGNTDASVKCRNCDGQRIFKNVTCPSCSRSGFTRCDSCKGKPWPDARCAIPECKEGRLPCPGCQGSGWQIVKCPFCEGGRFRASGAAGNADVTVKCRNCEVNGQQGNGTLRTECSSCQRTGRVTCDTCGGAFGRKGGGSQGPPMAQVFTTESCGTCNGAGWPEPDKAVPCSKCRGLGVQIKPTSDPSKTLE
jgi:hypothetical protein